MKILSAFCALTVLVTPIMALADASTTAQIPLVLHAVIPQASSVETPVIVGAVNPSASYDGVLGDQQGDALLQHLATLFVLDKLFATPGNGLLATGPVTLGNIIILYHLFFSPGL